MGSGTSFPPHILHTSSNSSYHKTFTPSIIMIHLIDSFSSWMVRDLWFETSGSRPLVRDATKLELCPWCPPYCLFFFFIASSYEKSTTNVEIEKRLDESGRDNREAGSSEFR